MITETVHERLGFRLRQISAFTPGAVFGLLELQTSLVDRHRRSKSVHFGIDAQVLSRTQRHVFYILGNTVSCRLY